MKKLLLFVAMICVVSAGAGCKKSESSVEGHIATGTVFYGGDPAADGTGYVIRTSDMNILVPENLPDKYRQPTISQNVRIVFEYAGRTYQPGFISAAGFPVIRLLSIIDI